jgi:hypothetical protein
MHPLKSLFRAGLILALALVFMDVAVGAQTLSNVTSTPITFSVAESLTVNVTGGPIVIPSNGSASNQISATVSWNLHNSGNTAHLSMLAYFGSTTALSGAFGGSIDVSKVFLSFNGGTATACNGTKIDQETRAPAGSTCSSSEYFVQNSSLGSTGTSPSQTYVLSIPSAATISPDNYSGSLLISAGTDI